MNDLPQTGKTEEIDRPMMVGSMFALALMFGLAVGGLGGMHIYFAFANLTTVGMLPGRA